MDPTSAPLADYFWIAGIDSLSYGESSTSPNKTAANGTSASPHVDTTIEEDVEGDLASTADGGHTQAAARHSRTNSWNRLSRLSNDARLSIQSLEEPEEGMNSNRSSVTIRAVPASNGNGTSNATGLMGDFDFDKALRKFANERETFLDDLSFSAGTVTHNRPPMTSRAEILRHDELDAPNGRKSPLLKSVGGSIRRKISFRDLNSMKKQPSRNGKHPDRQSDTEPP